MAYLINKEVFFSYVRRNPFGGRLTPQQVDGLSRILDYWEAHYRTRDIRWLAYCLATAYHETAHTMQPVREMGGEKYLRSKKYYPWVGEGLVQVTWEENHRKFGATKPGQLMTWEKALPALFEGMIHGKFTGHRLSQYFAGEKEDARGARQIVNGTDKAGLIKDYYTAFLGALRPSLAAEPPEDVSPEEAKPDSTPVTKDPQVLIPAAGGLGASLIAAVSSPWGVAALIVLVLAAAGGAYFYYRNKEKWTKGV
jgi:putative chitinase